MKKLVFAAQVFSLMAMLPFVVILEMNQSKAEAPESNSTPGFKQSTATITTTLLSKKNGKTGNEISPTTPEIFLLFKAF
jgi:hypothetical protein